MIKKQRPVADGDWKLYETGKEYNFRLGLYEKTSQNERFYRGDQWGGVRAEGLPMPVFNLFKRIIGYYISSVMSDATAMRYSYSQPRSEGGEKKIDGALDIVNGAAAARWEKLQMNDLLADALLDAALTGDAVAYTSWNPLERTGQAYEGDFVTSLVENTNVFFGDPNSHDVQSQPYILIAARENVESVKEQARRAGMGEETVERISPDSDTYTQSGDLGMIELAGTKCITLVKLWRGKNGTVMYRKSTRDVIITEAVDTRLTKYPVCYFNWTKARNCWHGEAVGTGLIDNQIFINKAFAMVMKHMTDTAFSKVIYDSTVIDEWSNRVGEAIAVNGNVDNVARVLQSGQMQSGMLEVIGMAIAQTKEFLGATDAALGDVDPQNTSAIIAVQEASNMPLENIRRQMYRFIEDLGMIWLDFMMRYYDSLRLVPVKSGEKTEWVKFSPKEYENELFSCRIDVGATSGYSEITTINTLDGLLRAGKITLVQYLERLPKNILPKKQELIDEAKKQTEAENGLKETRKEEKELE